MPSSLTSNDGRFLVKGLFALLAVFLVGLGLITIGAVAAGGSGGGGSGAAATTTTAKISLKEFSITGQLTAPAGELVLAVTNDGTMTHNLTVDGKGTTGPLNAGASGTLDMGTVSPGTYQLYCSVPGHKDSGMLATFTVTAASAGGTSASGSMAGMNMSGTGSSASSSATPTAADYAKMDANMLASFAKFPATTKGTGNALLVPKVLPDGTKQFELTAEIAKWEVSPGKIVDAWTYNGIVPAPEIKVNVGDKVSVILHNKLPVDTDIHWHGIDTPFDMDGVAPITQDPIKPGTDFTYSFTADKPEMGMYHPHLHGVTAVPNGMFGVFQVGPTPIVKGYTVDGYNVPADVTPAVDIPMVLNDAGVIGLTLNGKAFPATAPIVVNQGDWIAVTYYNEGLQAHPMHLHQFPQLVTAEDGFPVPQPYLVDTLLVAPGQRFTVMVHADKKGTWVWHCHILNHVESDAGMMGMVTAIVVK